MSLPIWEGYPHTTSVLTSNGVQRILDYDGKDESTLITDYSCGFVRGCPNGIYLTWLNPWGGYSHWLFSNIYIEERKVKSLGEINNYWKNRNTATSNSFSLGKQVSNSIEVSAKVDYFYMRELITLAESQEVYLYTKDAGLSAKKFSTDFANDLRVTISDASHQVINSKYNREELRLNINLPDRYVQTMI